MPLELRGVSKSFGNLIANDQINLKVGKGEIHAILGENGAGKSTLMNIVYGLLQPDSGEILVDDQTVKIYEPSDAIKHGIGMVHQHFMLIPVFTVAENIALGREKSKFGIMSLAEIKAKIKKLSDEFKFDINPDAIIEDLPVGVQQRVEIVKALMYDAKVLILDEPTAVLTPQETDELLNVMKVLKSKGTSIIFITHKLREVKEVADKITIIRLGKVVGTQLPTATQEELANLMVGRQVDLAPNKTVFSPGANVLEINNLNIFNDAGRKVVNNLSLNIRAGEIVAIAGVQGNGQSEKLNGIEAVSIVEFPAIESNFVALSEHLELAKVDDEKKILMGAALIPNKNIYRKNGNDEYYIFFSDDTVRKASELFLMNSNQNNATLEHEKKLKDLSVVESWIVEDTEMDKSKKYGLNAPVGTWMVSMKVNNDAIWNDFVKTGKVKGFSIEGYFSDKLEMSLQIAKEQELIEKIKSIITNAEINK